MKTNLTNMVGQFTKAHTPTPPGKPIPFSTDDAGRIINVIEEELDEFASAFTFTEQVDALADIVYIATDMCIRNGIDIDRVLQVVHAANMRKVTGTTILRDKTGKIKKPESWYGPEPEIEAILNDE